MVQTERNQGPISVVFLVHAGLFPVEPSDHPGAAFGSEPLKLEPAVQTRVVRVFRLVRGFLRATSWGIGTANQAEYANTRRITGSAGLRPSRVPAASSVRPTSWPLFRGRG
jgi:hypothetical protein